MQNVLFIPGNTPSSKNSRQSMTLETKPYQDKKGRTKTWKNVNIPSKLTSTFKKESLSYFIQQRPQWLAMKRGLEYPLMVEFTFIRDSKRKFDLINMAQIIQDMMVDVGWVEDDNYTVITPYFGKVRIDKENPGCEIRIINNVNKEYL